MSQVCVGMLEFIRTLAENKVRHLELTFDAEWPPPPHQVQQELLMSAEESGEYV
jgi:hypothetical protein